jgi:hypothetical protein
VTAADTEPYQTTKMPKIKDVPDAWDDDWESQADRIEANSTPAPVPEPEPALTKSERLARHVDTNRKLWESASVLLPLLPKP